MAKFTDPTGQEWAVEITIGHLKTLKADHGLDLRDALKKEDNSLAECLSDPDRFGQLMWFLCGDQAGRLKLEPEAFARRFNGETYRAAVGAIWTATFDFFHGARAATKAGEAFRAGMEQMDETLGKVWDKARESLTSGSWAGNSAASPGSTPAP